MVVSSTVIGILLGLLAGWRGGWIDAVLGRVFDVVFAFPSLLIAIMAVALFGKGLVAPVIAMSIAYAPFVARLTRSLVTSERSRPYVSAYRVQGFSGGVDRAAPRAAQRDAHRRRAVDAELRLRARRARRPVVPRPRRAGADRRLGRDDQRGAGRPLGGYFLPAIVPAVAVVIVVVAVNVIGEELSDRIGGGIPA